MVSTARIVAVCTSTRKGTPKTAVPWVELKIGHGLSGDAHAGPWHRQVSLLALESIRKMQEKGLDVGPGSFAENITTSGIDLPALAPGTLLKLGETAVIEITQIGKECHTRCAVYHRAGDCVMPREGVFARVRVEGRVQPGDPVHLLDREEP